MEEFSYRLGRTNACRSGSPTILVEVMENYDLWLWHAYFVMPRTSHYFSNFAHGVTPHAHYFIQGE